MCDVLPTAKRWKDTFYLSEVVCIYISWRLVTLDKEKLPTRENVSFSIGGIDVEFLLPFVQPFSVSSDIHFQGFVSSLIGSCGQ